MIEKRILMSLNKSFRIMALAMVLLMAFSIPASAMITNCENIHYSTSTLYVSVWNDDDCDTKWDTGETGIDVLTELEYEVQIRCGNIWVPYGFFNEQQTGSDGKCTFRGLVPGEYRVIFNLPTGDQIVEFNTLPSS